MLSLDRLKVMCHLQNKLNCLINEDWVHTDWQYLRAAMIEGAEGIDHTDWKWWKKQDLNLPQLQMEIVDIFHFYLSHFIKSHKGDTNVAALSVHHLTYSEMEGQKTKLKHKIVNKDFDLAQMSLLDKLDVLIGLAAFKEVSMKLFYDILKDVQLTDDDLYKQYVSKNVLNIFRQDHGYKVKNYIKIWNGQEDNVYLEQFMNELDLNDSMYADNLYSKLQAVYLTLK